MKKRDDSESAGSTRSTSKTSAGLLVHRTTDRGHEFLLVHPGGPFWADRDAEAWGIPKGLVEAGEDAFVAARREFTEETGFAVDASSPVALAPVRANGKTIHAWLVEADVDAERLVSNTFEIEWPPRSGKRATFPEIDRAAYFDAEVAFTKIHKGQRAILVAALEALGGAEIGAPPSPG
jgi:predicted NUDIX family NTP pyrophosphohydrolase